MKIASDDNLIGREFGPDLVAGPYNLKGREFGSDLVAGPSLDRWLTDSDRPGLAVFLPNLPDYVQIELFLCAYEQVNFDALKPPSQAIPVFSDSLVSAREKQAARVAADVSALKTAKCLVKPELLATLGQDFGENPADLAAWLYGAAAAKAMRDSLREAFDSRALQRLDAVTKTLAGRVLPIVTAPAPQAAEVTPPAPAKDGQAEAAIDRQDRRLAACVAAKLKMPANDYEHLPAGVGRLAKLEGFTRQAFCQDVKAALKRQHAKVRAGVIRHGGG